VPYKDPDPSDPNVLVGVVLPAESETMQDMAYSFAEEFARMGYDTDGLLRVFQNPFYAGAHQAYRALGAEAIRKIIAECLAAWGGVKFSILDFELPIEARGGEIQNPKPVLSKTEGSKIKNGGRER
jgi:hypothetical protein